MSPESSNTSEIKDPTLRPAAGILRPELRREIFGILLFLFGLFIGLSLIASAEDRSLIGPVGETISMALTFVVGRWVAWLVPLLILVAAFRVFLGRPSPRLSVQVLGVLGFVISMCALIALPGADEPELKAQTYCNAGTLGVFVVDAEGMGLAWQLGSLGSVLALGGMGLISVLLATNLLLASLFAKLAAGWTAWRLRRQARRQARLSEDQSPLWRSRVFGALPTEELESPEAEPEFAGAAVAAALPARSRRKGGGLFGWGGAADLTGTGANSHRVDSAADAIGIGLPGVAGHGVPTGDDATEVSPTDEVVDDQPIGPAHPKIVDGFSPLPVSNRRTDASLWDLDEDGTESKGKDAAEIGLAGVVPKTAPAAAPGVKSASAPDANALTAAEARMLHRTQAEQNDAKDEDAAPDSDEAPEADDDPLFETADVAKRLGITAATSNASPTALQAAEDARRAAAAGVLSDKEYADYVLPAVELLDDPPKVDSRMSREELLEISQTLEKTLSDFGIQAKVIQVTQGPVVTRFELKPAPGVKVSRITSLEQDISMALKATNPVRIIAPIPGKAAVGIEVPNRRRAGVYLKELISCDTFWGQSSPLTFALGKTIEGDPYFCDLAKMPHLLIAGATGAGKSVCINAIVCSILYRQKPDKVKFLFVDPKRVELSLYQEIPHLLAPVVSDPKRAAGALAWAVEQMEERYEKLVEFSVRNIDGYNAIVADPRGNKKAIGKRLLHMPHLVIVLDELADLMVVAKADVEEHIQRLAQMARAVGIHLIVATQRPSVNVITGVIKANFPARIAFQVSSKADSRVIMDLNGAETLLGRGDLLFHPGGAPKPARIQGCFVSEAEVERLVEFIKQQSEPNYIIEEFQPLRDEKGRPLTKFDSGSSRDEWDDDDGYEGETEDYGEGARGTNRTMGSVGREGEFVPHAGGSAWAGDDEIDEALVRSAARLVLEARKASVSLLQRRLKVGFARAGRLMDMLEEIGIVGPFQGSKPRDILVDPDNYLAQMDAHERAVRTG